jgi:hypothetical protein
MMIEIGLPPGWLIRQHTRKRGQATFFIFREKDPIQENFPKKLPVPFFFAILGSGVILRGHSSSASLIAL